MALPGRPRWHRRRSAPGVPGATVILATSVEIDDAETREHRPTAVFVDELNRVTELRAERVTVVPG